MLFISLHITRVYCYVRLSGGPQILINQVSTWSLKPEQYHSFCCCCSHFEEAKLFFLGPFLWLIVLVSYCCCNKFKQTQWLKSTQTYDLRVLQVWSPKIKVSARMCFLLEFVGQNCFPHILLSHGPSSKPTVWHLQLFLLLLLPTPASVFT